MPETLAAETPRVHWLGRVSPGLWIALGFLVFSVLALNSYGQTWDEGETRVAGLRNVEIVRAVLSGQPVPEWPWHELPGYYFVLDLARGAVAWTLIRVHALDEVRAFHFANVLLAVISVSIFYRLTRRVSGSTRTAVLSTLILASLPQFLAHSQNNPKDLPALFAYVLAIYTFARLDAKASLTDAVYAGLALGLALTTTVSGLLLVPIFAAWAALMKRRVRVRSIVVLVSVAAVAAFSAWPWLWSDPIANTSWALQYIATFNKTSLSVLYLGRLYGASELPWHYSVVLLLATTPVVYLLAATGSLLFFRPVKTEHDVGSVRAALLGWLWFGIPVIAEMRAPMRYDGVRHLLMAMPGMCLAAGVGLNALLRAVERTRIVRGSPALRSCAAPACAALVFAIVGAQIVRAHPYENAYLNEAANLLIPNNAEDVFEVEYWCQTYKEGAEWLNAHAEPDAEIFVGRHPACANDYLWKPSKDLSTEALSLFDSRMRPAYFMVMTRRALYTLPIDRVRRNYEPVFRIRRQNATLLEVYSNRRAAR